MFHNENQVFSGGGIAHLSLGRTLDELRAWIETHNETADPPPSDLAIFLGGVDANPGAQARLILELDQGTFGAVCSPWEGPGKDEATLDVTTFAAP